MKQFVSVFVMGNVHTQQRWKAWAPRAQIQTSQVRLRTSRFSGVLPLRPTLSMDITHKHLHTHTHTHTPARKESNILELFFAL